MGGIIDILKKHESELAKGVTEHFEGSLVKTPYEMSVKEVKEIHEVIKDFPNLNAFKTVLLVLDTYVNRHDNKLAAYERAKRNIKQALIRIPEKKQTWMYMLS